MAFALAVLSLLIWLALTFRWHGFWRADQRLPRGVADADAWPYVTVLVPARNEAETIARCVRSLLAQDYPGRFEVIVINDASSDETRRKAERAGAGDARLRVIDAPALQAGWAGKMWALNAGVSAARPQARDVYWLTDADIVHEPGVLRRLAGHAGAGDLAMASLMVRLRCTGFWEKLLVPAFIFSFALIYPFRAVNNPDSAIAGAAGGCMLIRHQALDAIGGFEGVRGAVIDDCTIAKAVKQTGRRIWLGLAEDSHSLRGYDSLGDFWNMVVRSAYTQLDHSPLMLAGALGGLALTYLVPPLLVFSADYVACLAALTACGVMWWCYRPTVRYHGLPAVWALTLPLAALLFGLMTVHSAIRHHAGRGVQWKDRELTHSR
jgi:hopene-associated glycosyltransferase HpnB